MTDIMVLMTLLFIHMFVEITDQQTDL